MKEKEVILKGEMAGICKIETSEEAKTITVWTKHCFITASRLAELMAETGAKDIEIGFRYDREDGFVYTFTF